MARRVRILELMKLAPLCLAAAFALGSIVACVGDDPTFDGGTDDDAGPDTSTGTDAADAFVATDTSTVDAATDAADAAPATPMTWQCTGAISPFANSTNHATNCSDTSVHVSISYTAHQDVLGNVSVSASVTVGTGTPVTGMMTWAAGTAGAANATDTFPDDVCTGGAPQAGSFAFSLDKPTTTLSITYTDADLNAGSVVYTAACTVMNN